MNAVADALAAAGYTVTLIGDRYEGAHGTDRRLPPFQRAAIACRRGTDYLLTSSSYLKQMASLPWNRVAAVVCYSGSVSLIGHLLGLCRSRGVPLIVDCVEWFDRSHTFGGRFGPFALDSELRMRWLNKRVGNLICISSFLAQYYRRKGCKVIRIPPLVGANCPTCLSGHANHQPRSGVSLVYAGFPGRKELFAELLRGVRASRQRGLDVTFKLVGATEAQLAASLRTDGHERPDLTAVTCYGRLSRKEALGIVASADYTVLLRPQQRYANAGFPSKLVESLSLGVPVMATPVSDVAEYLRDGHDSFLLAEPTAASVEIAIRRAAALSDEQKHQMRIAAHRLAHQSFDCRRYASVLAEFISSVRPCS